MRVKREEGVGGLVVGGGEVKSDGGRAGGDAIFKGLRVPSQPLHWD